MTPPLLLQLQLRAAVLQAVFSDIATCRMAGLPLCHPGLQVEALGFEPLSQADAQASGLLADGGGGSGDGLWQAPLGIGVLVTPWFMNLVALPLQRDDTGWPTGLARPLTLGGHRFAFLGAQEAALGGFGACSLCSPMQDFADAAAARAMAQEVLALLRQPVEAAAPAAPALSAAPLAPVPSRRGFLFGRSGAARPAG